MIESIDRIKENISKGIKLDTRDRNILADIIISKTMQIKDLASYCGIKKSLLTYIAYTKKKNNMSYGTVGNYSRIDYISNEIIINKVQENKNISIESLKQLIRDQAKLSFLRKNPQYIINDKRKSRIYISPRSVNRYYIKFLVNKNTNETIFGTTVSRILKNITDMFF